MSAGTVYLWDVSWSVDHVDQTSSSGASLQSGCTQLTLFGRTFMVCQGTNAQQLQASLQPAAAHAIATLAGKQTWPVMPLQSG